MGRSLALRQTYRVYALVLAAWSAWSYAWITTTVEMSSVALAGGWFAIAAAGAVLAAGLFVTREQTFDGDRARTEKFRGHLLSTWPLYGYVGLLAGWSVVSFGWYMQAGALLSDTAVAYGWFAVAAYGGLLLIGLVSKHPSAIAEASVADRLGAGKP